jgi:hypothetical protein
MVAGGESTSDVLVFEGGCRKADRFEIHHGELRAWAGGNRTVCQGEDWREYPSYPSLVE